MYRFTTLAALLALLALSPVMTGCDSGKGGTERKSITAPPATNPVGTGMDVKAEMPK